MIIFGVDPGLSAMGYGVIEQNGGGLSLVASATIRTGAKLPFAQRLMKLHSGISDALRIHKPDAVVMEKPIYCQNMKTALILGQAGGMAILSAAQAEIPLVEFSPLEVKKATTGKGRASKDQVQKMVKVLLGLKELPGDEHVCDALACAVCFAHSQKMLKWRERSR